MIAMMVDSVESAMMKRIPKMREFEIGWLARFANNGFIAIA
jgi:hypothetical protein